MDHVTTDRLAAAFRAGRHDALGPLVQGLARTLLAQAYRFVRDWDLAADLVQDAWMRATSSIARYDPRRPFLPWLRTILRNCCLQTLARQQRRPELIPLASVAEPPTNRPADQADQAAQDRRPAAAVARHLAALPETQRQAVAMIDIEQRGHAEVAEALGVAPESLRVILHRGRRALASRLSEEDLT